MAKSSLEFRHLEAFRAIMRSGTVTGAGAMLGISQPAVTFDHRLIRPDEVRETFGRAALAQAIRRHARHIQETVQARTGLQA